MVEKRRAERDLEEARPKVLVFKREIIIRRPQSGGLFKTEGYTIMRVTYTLILVAIGVVLGLGLSSSVSQAQTMCCENQTPANGPGSGDDTVSGPLPTPGCTDELTAASCFRFDNLQQKHAVGTACTGADPDGAGPATGTTCSPEDVEQLENTRVPALSGWGVIVFLVLASGIFVFYRRRSRTSIA